MQSAEYLKVQVRKISNYYRVALGSDDCRVPMMMLGKVYTHFNPCAQRDVWVSESDDCIISGFNLRSMAIKYLVLRSVDIPGNELESRMDLFCPGDYRVELPEA